jgi:hypothetical protein
LDARAENEYKLTLIKNPQGDQFLAASVFANTALGEAARQSGNPLAHQPCPVDCQPVQTRPIA